MKRKGSYLLLTEVKEEVKVEVGALGTITFAAGDYAYAGSAQGGLASRVARHLSNDKKLHWHIDYLLARKETKIEQVFAKKTEEKEAECRLASTVAEAGEPIANFGCSDCDCDSHLFRIENESKLKQLLNKKGYSPYQPK